MCVKCEHLHQDYVSLLIKVTVSYQRTCKLKMKFYSQTGAGQMPQWLRAFVALVKDQSLVPNTYIGGSQLPVTSALGEAMSSVDLCRELP